jgi:hypothetical protein
MTDVARPVPKKERTSRIGKRRVAAAQRRRVSFAELVEAHFLREAARGRGEIYTGEAEERYREFEAEFERRHGRIVNSYWATSRPSAVALTDQAESRTRGLRMGFHRVSDWATKDEPEIATCLHECDELAIKASQVLRGKTLRICMHLVMCSASHLLSLVDEPSEHEAKGKKELALRLAKRELDRARAYYHQAANGQAQLYYFLGMMLGTAVVALAALGIGSNVDLWGIDNREFFGSLTAGALGALVSVMSRIGSGRFRLDYDVGRQYPIFLGAIRPMIGAIFGLALYFAVTSSLLDLFKLPTDDNRRFYFLLVIAFVAGFSERWARDTLLAVGSRGQPGEPASKPAPEGRA